MSPDIIFTKETLDSYFKELAKEYKKLNGNKMKAEIVLIGGAAILVNYGFREMTYDIDAIIRASWSMKEAINKVSDKIGLPNGWLNSDFTKTKSYSPKLLQYSKYYKCFGNVLEVRTIKGEYLIAMKLMSGRKYKNDISDVIGILNEQKNMGEPIAFEDIKSAVENLYNGWDKLPVESRKAIVEIMKSDQYEFLYSQYKTNEQLTKETLMDFEKKHVGITNENNIDEILKQLALQTKKPKKDSD